MRTCMEGPACLQQSRTAPQQDSARLTGGGCGQVYPYGRAFLHPPNLEKNVILEGHDLRGLPAYQELVAARPDILVPEGASA